MSERVNPVRGSCAIVGVGQTPLSRAAAGSELDMAVDACLSALRDAGIAPADVDGMVRFGNGFEGVSHVDLARSLGIRELTYAGEALLGGDSTASMIHHAVAALVAEQATVVVAYRSIKQSGGKRFGRADNDMKDGVPAEDIVVHGSKAFLWPYWMMVPAHLFGLWGTRYMAKYDVGVPQLNDALAQIALDQRAYANRRPGSIMHERTLSRTQFDEARMISWPLSLFTICLECDGAAAVVVTSTQRAKHLDAVPATILATSQSLAPHRDPGDPFGDELIDLFPPPLADRLWAEAGVSPRDVSVAQIYDATSMMTLLGLELYGFVPMGEAWKYVVDNGIGADSPLPINTHGGHISDGYIQGMTGLVEAVHQVRGTAVNQVPDVTVSFYGALAGSAVVLSSSDANGTGVERQ